MKNLPVGDEFYHADRRTDMTKLIVALRNFVNAPNSEELHATTDQPAGQRPDRRISARLHLARSHLNYAVPFFLLFEHLGSVLRLPYLRPRSANAIR